MKKITLSLALCALLTGGVACLNNHFSTTPQPSNDFSSASFEDDDYVYTSGELDGELDTRDLLEATVIEELNIARAAKCDTAPADLMANGSLTSTALFMHDVSSQDLVPEDVRNAFRSLNDVASYQGWLGVSVQGLSVGADADQPELGPENFVNRLFGSAVAKSYLCDVDFSDVGIALGHNAQLNSVGYVVLGQVDDSSSGEDVDAGM